MQFNESFHMEDEKNKRWRRLYNLCTVGNESCILPIDLYSTKMQRPSTLPYDLYTSRVGINFISINPLKSSAKFLYIAIMCVTLQKLNFCPQLHLEERVLKETRLMLWSSSQGKGVLLHQKRTFFTGQLRCVKRQSQYSFLYIWYMVPFVWSPPRVLVLSLTFY